jgi:hypothetical protein
MRAKARFREKFRRVRPFGWFAKAYGGLFFGFLGLFLLAHLIPGFEGGDTAPLTAKEAVWLTVFVLAVVGLGIGILWEYVDGFITVVLMLMWFYMELFTGPNAPKPLDWGYLFFYLILLGGVLHIVAGTRVGLRPSATVS